MTKLPSNVDELREHLQTLPNSRIVDKLMRFGIVLRSMCAYWSKCHG